MEVNSREDPPESSNQPNHNDSVDHSGEDRAPLLESQANSQPNIETQHPPATTNFPIQGDSNNSNNNTNANDIHYQKDNYQKQSLFNNTVSSLPLQMLIYFHLHYTVLFFLLNLCLFTYKAIKFYYPGRFLGWELTTVFLYLLINQSRLFMASKGNKTGGISPFGISLLLSMPMIVLHVYYITLQTYVLRVDLVINAIGLIFLGFEILISGFSMLNLFIISRRI
eukprot:gene66-70_t